MTRRAVAVGAGPVPRFLAVLGLTLALALGLGIGTWVGPVDGPGSEVSTSSDPHANH